MTDVTCEHTTALLSDRLQRLATPEDEARLDAHLAECAACRAEADAIAALWTELGALNDDEVPHERMRARFHAALAAYEERARASAFERTMESLWPRRPVFQAALAAALLAVGVLAGRWLPSPVDRDIADREQVRIVGLALLEHQSASERLRGVEWSRRVETDPRVVDALLETVRHDPSVNVRLAAVEALADMLDRPRVRAGLTEALAQQDAPMMQVTLATLLLEGDPDGAAAAVRRLLERGRLDPSVREYLTMALAEAGEPQPPASPQA